VPGDLRDEVIEYLRERELTTKAYRERVLKVHLDSGSAVEAICYTVDRTHRQYAGKLDEAVAAGIVTGAVGQSGRNEDYVFNTLQHLEALGIRDHWLETVGQLLPARPPASMQAAAPHAPTA
jgi:cation transport protein ChaC